MTMQRKVQRAAIADAVLRCPRIEKLIDEFVEEDLSLAEVEEILGKAGSLFAQTRALTPREHERINAMVDSLAEQIKRKAIAYLSSIPEPLTEDRLLLTRTDGSISFSIVDKEEATHVPPFTIILNGVRFFIGNGKRELTYEEIVELSGHKKDQVPSVTYRRALHDKEGCLCKGQKVQIKDGTIIDAVVTGAA